AGKGLEWIIRGDVKCEQLTQPASQTVQPGQRLTIRCQVSYSTSSYATAWIRQPAGKGLDSYIYYSDSVKNRFTVSRDNIRHKVYLQMNSLTAGDSAVYHCARAMVTQKTETLNKNSKLKNSFNKKPPQGSPNTTFLSKRPVHHLQRQQQKSGVSADEQPDSWRFCCLLLRSGATVTQKAETLNKNSCNHE
uniref:Ig-like domain-containing protein n=1 Tax=Poecilia latipinna TaxID=48699 RepID=A0A3B3VPA7_9TELE